MENTAHTQSREQSVNQAFDDFSVAMLGLQWGKLLTCVNDERCRQHGPSPGDPPLPHANIYEEIKTLSLGHEGEPSTALDDLNQKLQEAGYNWRIFGPSSDDKSMIVAKIGAAGRFNLIDEDGFFTISPEQTPHGPLAVDVGEISARTVIQNRLGDCYFMSTLSGLAETEPSLAAEMIKKQGASQYTVTFPGDSGNPVTVKAPNAAELEFFAPYRNGNFAAIMEKAHRKYTGKSLLDPGEDGADTLRLLTGHEPNIFDVPRLQSAEQNQNLTDQFLKERKREHSITIANSNVGESVADGIVPGHWYTLFGYDAERQIVKLRNPHGIGPNAEEDGYFEMPLSSFARDFSRIETVNTQ